MLYSDTLMCCPRFSEWHVVKSPLQPRIALVWSVRCFCESISRCWVGSAPRCPKKTVSDRALFDRSQLCPLRYKLLSLNLFSIKTLQLYRCGVDYLYFNRCICQAVEGNLKNGFRPLLWCAGITENPKHGSFTIEHMQTFLPLSHH